jgi:hypothetical protein
MYRRVSFVTLHVALIAAWTTVVQPGKAEQIVVPKSFITGEGYIHMDENGRAQYVMGLFDGLMAGTLFGASPARIKAVQGCNVGWSNIQLAEILRKYINERPEDWHLGAHILFYNRMIELCPQARRN